MTNFSKAACAQASAGRQSGNQLVGYWLNTGMQIASGEAKSRLEDLCSRRVGHKLAALECESGVAQNPMRFGLWKALRKLVCNRCQPKRMSFGIINIEDFLTQALSSCPCGQAEGLEGIVIANLRHISSDHMLANQFILLMAEHGKHVVSEDGLCISCCNQSTKSLLAKKRALVSRAS